MLFECYSWRKNSSNTYKKIQKKNTYIHDYSDIQIYKTFTNTQTHDINM